MLRALGRITYRSYVVVLIGSVALTAMLTLFRPATTALHTAAFAAQVLPVPVKVQPWLAPEPERVKTTYLSDDGADAEADIYVIPDGRQRAGLLIFLGANAAGADDPDVINLGQALARAGFAVMYYWSPTMGERAEVDVGEIPNIVAGLEHLQRQAYVDRQRVGLAGFSVGASFALAAAADPRIADDIAFGGYYDAADLLAQIAAGRAVDGTTETPWEVDKLTRRVFDNMLTPESDSEAARRLLAGVGSVAEARELYDQLPDAFRADVDAISPSMYVEQWSGDTVMRVMHDRGDPLIPVGESRRLVAALQEQRPDVATYYTETDIFRHVRPDAETDWRSMLRGAWQLYRHMYHIVAVARQP